MEPQINLGLSSMNEKSWCEQLVLWHSLHGWSPLIMAESALLVVRELPSSWWSPWESKQQLIRQCWVGILAKDIKKKYLSRTEYVLCISDSWLFFQTSLCYLDNTSLWYTVYQWASQAYISTSSWPRLNSLR